MSALSILNSFDEWCEEMDQIAKSKGPEVEKLWKDNRTRLKELMTDFLPRRAILIEFIKLNGITMGSNDNISLLWELGERA